MCRRLGPQVLGLLVLAHFAAWGQGNGPHTVRKSPEPIWQQEVVLPDREDLGQYLGTLFEVKSASGRLLAAAGFVGGSQTSAINDHRSLNFYIAPSEPVVQAQTWRFPGRPYRAGSLFRLMTDRNRLFAYPLGFLGPFREFNIDSGNWSDVDSAASNLARSMRVVSLQAAGSHLLAIYQRRIVFGDSNIGLDAVDLNEDELIESGAYFNGRVLLSIIGGFSANRPHASLADCAWNPARNQLTDCKRIQFADDHPDPGRQHVVLGFHLLADGRVLLYGLNGFLYEYGREALRPLVKIVLDRSWQVYSSIERYDKVLLGQYPSGNLVSLKLGEQLPSSASMQPWSDSQLESVLMRPPIQSEVSIRRDEAQSAMTIGPLLAVGMWPWGEVFEGIPGGRWNVVLPTPVSDKKQSGGGHPFETLTGSNCMGMRVFQIMLWKGGYVFQRTVKNEIDSCSKVIASVPEAELDPYGRVYYREVPGLLTCSLPWTGKARRLRFTLESDATMRVSLNGNPLCSRAFDGAKPNRELARSTVTKWILPAVGVYGRRTRLPDAGVR